MTTPAPHTVLLAGGTGRTGRRVLQQLLDRGVSVRAVVRSPGKLPPEVAGHPRLTVIEASLLSLGDEALRQHLRGCDAVISCLGHVLDLKGVFGSPRDLVTQATRRLCRAIEALRPAAPVKVILMSSVSVHRSNGLDARRGSFERAFLRLLCAVLPPARDNQRAAEVLLRDVGQGHPSVEWAIVRPDTLLEGEGTPYALHAELVDGLFAPGRTRMANVATFMCQLVTDPATWARWQGQLPVITDAQASEASAA
ncbi:MAG: NAD(P)H-binding protein [Anaeromyxobacter sp.]